MGIPTLVTIGPVSATYTATPGANRLGVYFAASGGGGGGGYPCGSSGGPGGSGGYGFVNKPIAQPFAQPYSIGAAGNGGNQFQGGNAAGNFAFTNVSSANGGGGGSRGNPSNPGASGSTGNQTDATFTSFPRNFVFPSEAGAGGGGGPGPGAGSPGVGGQLIIFENTGT
jgi:hypothetical protein